MTRRGLLVILGAALALAGCNLEPPGERIPITLRGHRNLVPVDVAPESLVVREVVYVPIYSSIYWGDEAQLTDLTAVMSVRNIDESHSLVITSVEYYDSDGRMVRQYLEGPARLGPLMTADFVIRRADVTGGAGANFLVKFGMEEPGPDPLIQAIMLGQIGSASISFLTEGRVVERRPARVAAPPATPATPAN